MEESTGTYQLVYDTGIVDKEVLFTLEEGGSKTRSFNFGDELEGETYYVYYTPEYKNNPEEEKAYPGLVTHFYTSKEGVGEGPYYYYAYTPDSGDVILHNYVGTALKGIREGDETTFLEYADGRLEEIILTYEDGYLLLPEGDTSVETQGEEAPERGRVGHQVDEGDVVYLP